MPGEQADEPRFFADVMLGRLARWLRILGYDVAYERGIEDDDLLRRSEKENRTVLTRDTGLMERHTSTRIEFLESEKPREQLQFMHRKYGIVLDRGRLFTRCSWCNGPLQDIAKSEVEGLVPPYVYETEEHFRRCPNCDKLYWRGTHGGRFIEQLFSEDE